MSCSNILPYAFSEPFIQEKKVQWDAFQSRLRAGVRSTGFDTVIHDLNDFLVPILQAAYAKEPLLYNWKAGDSWQAMSNDEAD